MYAQIGKIIFSGINGFNDFNRTDNITFAQHDLINAKPRLQPVGNDLEDITVTITLRQEFCDVLGSILSLKDSKTNAEILPFVMGNGRYLGDYVITGLTERHNYSFADGTTIEAVVELTLKEYVTSDKLEQQQQAARKQAFAVGDKSPVNVLEPSLPTLPKLAAIDVGAALANYNIVDQNIAEYPDNVSHQQRIGNDIKDGLGKIEKNLSAFDDKINELQATGANYAGLLGAVKNARDTIGNFKFPITSLSDLQANNLALASNMNSVRISSSGLLNLVIARQI